jgi:hypothetical protein
MKRIVALVSILCVINIFLSAQENTSKLIDQDQEKYQENVFNKEFDESEDTVDASRKLYDRIPEKLPDWVFNPIQIGQKVHVVGFSDPNMEKEYAYQQATLRAKAIFALLNLSAVSNIADDYTNLHESGKYSLYSTKFQDFSLSKAELAYNNSSIAVIDTFFTKYNEGLVLIEIDLNINSDLKIDTLEVKGEHLQIFIERNFRKEKIEFFNLHIRDNLANADSLDIVSQYNYRKVNRSYDISSIYGDSVIDFKERTYNYRTEIKFEKDSANAEMNMFSLNRGLWNGYISGLLSNITILSKQLASQVKNSNDFYTLKNEGLVRTVARNKISFGFNDFKMDENYFYIDLNGLIK